MYDFETVYDRTGMGSEKWDGAAAQGCPPGVVPLTVADMEFCAAPEIIDAVKKAADFGLWGYTGASAAYRQAVCGWMARRHGWRPPTEWMVDAGGVVPAMFAAVRAFTAPGDGVIVQPPVYPPFFGAVKAAGRQLLENPLRREGDRYVMDLEGLRAAAKRAKMMLFCSPHNPVGRVWTREEVAAVVEICRENGVILFSDEIHCDILMPGAVFTSVGALAEKYPAGCLVATAATKTFSLAGLPCAAIFVPDGEMRKGLERQMGHDGYMFNSYFGTVAVRAGYERGEDWLEAMLATVAENHRYAGEYIEKNIPGVKLLPMEGTYLGWMDFSAFGLAPEARQAFLHREAQLYLTPGQAFGAGGEDYERINLACPRSVLEGALDRLRDAAVRRGGQ